MTITTGDPTLSFIDDLRAVLGSRVSTAQAELLSHGRDEGYPDVLPPQVVVYAESEADVVETLRVARERGVPVTPYAAGSGLEGNAVPVRGGISLDMTRMRRVLNIDAASFLATVEPGVPYPELSRLARPHGLFFAVDPGAEATLGGMAATGASGTAAVRYGTMRDNVVEMRVALTDGRVIRVGSRARKSSAGYDLLHLFVGSEGTLGVITAADGAAASASGGGGEPSGELSVGRPRRGGRRGRDGRGRGAAAHRTRGRRGDPRGQRLQGPPRRRGPDALDRGDRA
jgi:D-lactate dehydrogenase (cytochrome)